jgi:hypothetical protein
MNDRKNLSESNKDRMKVVTMVEISSGIDPKFATNEQVFWCRSQERTLKAYRSTCTL